MIRKLPKEGMMSKARSPQYPAIGLKEAVDLIEKVYEHDYQNPIPREVAAKHMGYNGLNGKSLGVLSALKKYGLLEGRGNDSRVSDLGVQIIAHPPGSAERAQALQAAGALPELFAELDNRFAGGKASDQALRSYLLTQKFIPSGADAAIRAYRETKQLVEGESRGYPASEPAPEPRVSQPTPPITPVEPPPQTIVGGAHEPYTVSLSRGGLRVNADLKDEASVDELITALNAWKLLVRPLKDIKVMPPEEDDE
jgi:hypothetical protein